MISITLGIWICCKCKYKKVVPIYAPPMKCPKCDAEYEIIKILENAHIVHPIPIQRLKGTDRLNVVLPIVFAVGRSREDFEEYMSIVNEIKKENPNLSLLDVDWDT